MADGWVAALERALDADDARAAHRLVVQPPADRDARDRGLDLLAGRAAAEGDDGPALGLLLDLVDRLQLGRRVVHRMLVDETAIDDVAQDALIAVATSIGSFRQDAKFTTWFTFIARNRAVDHLRRIRATEPLDPEDVGDAQRISSVIASRHTVRDLIVRLDDPYRTAVVLRDIEQLSYAEASAREQVGVNTMKSRVARGRAQLARMLSSGDRR